MYRFLVILIVALLLNGCGSLQREKIVEASSELVDKAGRALRSIGQSQAPDDYDSELRPLFAQPYIDPLTRYLQRHRDDEPRASQLLQVRRERDRRCAAVAERYNADPLTAGALARYRAGYSFSCPQDVAAYAGQLKRQMAEAAEPAEPAAPKPGQRQPPSVSKQQLNDCYLLTAIRNFSEALKACRAPAEAGDVQAQNNMAQIAYAFRDHAVAYRWARQAAPESADAAYLLGQMYTAGQGVEQSSKKAETWYAKAARQGHAGAKAALGEGSSLNAGTNVN
jgi:hypothetical protein